MAYADSVMIKSSAGSLAALYAEGGNYILGSKLFGESAGSVYAAKVYADTVDGGYILGTKTFGDNGGSGYAVTAISAATGYALSTGVHALSIGVMRPLSAYFDGVSDYVLGSKLFGESSGALYGISAESLPSGYGLATTQYAYDEASGAQRKVSSWGWYDGSNTNYMMGSKLFGHVSGSQYPVSVDSDGSSPTTSTVYSLAAGCYGYWNYGGYGPTTSGTVRIKADYDGSYHVLGTCLFAFDKISNYQTKLTSHSYYDGSNYYYMMGSKLFGDTGTGSTYPIHADSDGSSPTTSTVYSLSCGTYGYWNYGGSFGPTTSGTVKIKADYDGFYHVLGTSLYGASSNTSGGATIGQHKPLTADPDLDSGTVYSAALRVRTDGVYSSHVTSSSNIYSSKCRIHSVVFDYDGVTAGDYVDIMDSSSSAGTVKLRLRANSTDGSISHTFANGVYMMSGIYVNFTTTTYTDIGCTVEYSY